MTLIYKLFKTGTLLSMVLMITAVTIQVFTRFFMESTPHWTEEAARIFFVYSVAFGTGTGIRNGDFIRLDLIGKYLSPGINRLLEIFTDIIIAGFAMIIIIHSIKFIKLGMDELSPALEITMGFVFISIALIGVSTFIFTIEKLPNLIKRDNSR